MEKPIEAFFNPLPSDESDEKRSTYYAPPQPEPHFEPDARSQLPHPYMVLASIESTNLIDGAVDSH